MSFKKIEKSFKKLKNYCETEEFKGYDPYDSLNSTIFNRIPVIRNNSYMRFIWSQIFKRSPINFRKIAGIKKDYNPKGLALFLYGYCNLYELNRDEIYLDKILFLREKLISLHSPGFDHYCWGYNFPWQSRVFYQKKYSPTVVATSFVINSLLKSNEIIKDDKITEIAISSSKFVLEDLNRNYDSSGDFIFSYSPDDNSEVYNASFLASRLLSQVYKISGKKILKKYAKSSIKFCCNHQNSDGSWGYGTAKFYQWIDNFHTGYNLEALYEYSKNCNDNEFDENLKKGTSYYLSTFFTNEGISRYFSDKTFPIDIHSAAQLIITLSRLEIFEKNRFLADRVIEWTIENMQDKKGYFYFQLKRFFNSKIPYMRWSQAWMFYAMSEYLKRVIREDIK